MILLEEHKEIDPDFQKLYYTSTTIWLQMKLNKATQEQIWSQGFIPAS